MILSLLTMYCLFLSPSSLPVSSLPFVLPAMPFTFPVAETQELQDMHYEILLPENSMENLSNPSQVITHEKKVHSLIKHGIKYLACGSQYSDGKGFYPIWRKVELVTTKGKNYFSFTQWWQWILLVWVAFLREEKTKERQFLLEHHQDQNIIYNFLVCKAALTSIDLTVNGQNTFNTSFMCWS